LIIPKAPTSKTAVMNFNDDVRFISHAFAPVRQATAASIPMARASARQGMRTYAMFAPA